MLLRDVYRDDSKKIATVRRCTMTLHSWHVRTLDTSQDQISWLKEIAKSNIPPMFVSFDTCQDHTSTFR
jgi:hypothetical protein